MDNIADFAEEGKYFNRIAPNVDKFIVRKILKEFTKTESITKEKKA